MTEKHWKGMWHPKFFRAPRLLSVTSRFFSSNAETDARLLDLFSLTGINPTPKLHGDCKKCVVMATLQRKSAAVQRKIVIVIVMIRRFQSDLLSTLVITWNADLSVNHSRRGPGWQLHLEVWLVFYTSNNSLMKKPLQRPDRIGLVKPGLDLANEHRDSNWSIKTMHWSEARR